MQEDIYMTDNLDFKCTKSDLIRYEKPVLSKPIDSFV